MNDDKSESKRRSRIGIKLTLAWLAVGVPLLWGVVETLRKAMALFT